MIDVVEVNALHNAMVNAQRAYRDDDDSSYFALQDARRAKFNYRPHNSSSYSKVRDYFDLRAAERTRLDNFKWYQYVLEAAHKSDWVLAYNFLKLAGIAKSYPSVVE